MRAIIRAGRVAVVGSILACAATVWPACSSSSSEGGGGAAATADNTASTKDIEATLLGHPPDYVVAAAKALEAQLSAADLVHIEQIDWASVSGQDLVDDPIVVAAFRAIAPFAAQVPLGSASAFVLPGVGSVSSALCTPHDPTCPDCVAQAEATKHQVTAVETNLMVASLTCLYLGSITAGVGAPLCAAAFLATHFKALTLMVEDAYCNAIPQSCKAQAGTACGSACCLAPATCVDAATSNCGGCKADESSCGGACCPAGQTCADPATGVCCGSGEAVCGTACCGAGQTCADAATGTCCGAGETACGNACCKPGDTCQDPASGTCAPCQPTDTPCGAVCCTAGQTCADAATGTCCGADETACGTACCDPGDICQDPASGTCAPCQPSETVCGGVCCAAGQTCADAATGTCCGIGETACGTACCNPGEMCQDPATGTCVPCQPTETPCGSVCCAPGHSCKDAATGVCGGCVPKTCADLGMKCGTTTDGCGKVLDCGVCGP